MHPEIKQLEDRFTVEEWLHELAYNGHNPRVVYIKKRIAALREKENELADCSE